MNLSVTLVADGINVTAANESQALGYLEEDARQFRGEWNYRVEELDETDDEPSELTDDVRVDVSVDESRGRGERTWTGSATFTVVLEGTDRTDALERARQVLAS